MPFVVLFKVPFVFDKVRVQGLDLPAVVGLKHYINRDGLVNEIAVDIRAATNIVR